MKIPFMGKSWELASRLAMLLMVSNVILVGLLAITTFAAINKKEHVVLVPPYLDKKVEVTWNSASADYYKSFGLYVASLLGNLTPKNIDFVIGVLSDFLDPAIYRDVRVKLIALKDDKVFQRSSGVTYFTAETLVFEPETNRVFVIGRLFATGFNNAVTANDVVYEMKLAIQNGMPRVLALTSYNGNQPHTMKWEESQPKQDPAQTQQAPGATGQGGAQ